MEITVSGQLAQIGLSVSVGAALGLFYDALRIPRIALASRLATALIDLLFWLCAALVLFALAMWSDSAAVRVSTLVFCGLGAVLYALSLGRAAARFFEKLALLLRRAFRKAAQPAFVLCRAGKKCVKKSKTLFPIIAEWFRISSDAGKRAGGCGICRTAPEVAQDEAQTGKYYY